MSELTALFENFAVLFMESAPWLLLGLLIAGLMHELVPVDILKKHMGNASTKAIGKAAVIGAPLPLCSCGVIPAAIGLRRSGASKPATVSFLVATPETGVDSVSVSYALLGPVFAIIRPVAAITSAIYAGLMVKWFDTPDANNQPQTDQAAATEADTSSACCSTQQPETKPETASASSCCSTQTQVAPITEPASCCSSAKKTEPAETKASCCVPQRNKKPKR